MYRFTVDDFVENITNHSPFDYNDMIKICKRKNNTKRDYLFVNKYQAKHYPVNAHDALTLFDALYEEIKKHIGEKEKVLVIGFAETATGISQRIAHKAICDNGFQLVYYIQTTREDIDTDIGTINFEEKHSHATSQKLYYKNNVPDYDRVLFVEDEITTGNTILNFIEEFKKINPEAKYAVASILNWQNAENKAKYKKLGIDRICLVEGQLRKEFPVISVDGEDVEPYSVSKAFKVVLSDAENPRLGMTREEFERYIKDIQKVSDEVYNFSDKKIAVIGTEESMYRSILVAEKIGKNATVRATTRSPITVSKDENYLIYNGMNIPSAYDTSRSTYLYDIDKEYSTAIVLPEVVNEEFVSQLTGKLKEFGVEKVLFYI